MAVPGTYLTYTPTIIFRGKFQFDGLPITATTIKERWYNAKHYWRAIVTYVVSSLSNSEMVLNYEQRVIEN